MKRLLWYIPLLLAVHNLEEALTLPGWQRRMPYSLPGSVAQFDVALLVVTLIPLLLTPWAVRAGRRSAPGLALCGVQAFVLVNACVHLAAAVYFLGYVPGLITAVFLNIPFSHDLFGRALHEGYLTRRDWLLLLIAAVVLQYPLIRLAWWVGMLVV